MSITIDGVYRRASLFETTHPEPEVPFRIGGLLSLGDMAPRFVAGAPSEGMCGFSCDGVKMSFEIASFEKSGKFLKFSDTEGYQWTFLL